MKTARQNYILASAILGAALLFSGCGNVHGKVANSSGSSSYSPNSSAGNVVGSTTGTVGGIGNPISSAATSGIPPANYRVGAYGYTSTTLTVYTRSILKVRFTPGVQDQTMMGNGFSPQYSHLGVYIGVNGASSPTEMLDNGAQGASAQRSHIFDLASSFNPTCKASDTNCLQPITIEITKPNYDYWCLNYGQYCSWTNVYQGHPWHGTLEVQTDLTDAIQ